MIDFGQFLGPLGGLLCIAWAMGAISGYAFFNRSIHALHKKFCEEQIASLQQQLDAIKRRQARRIIQQRAERQGDNR